MRARGLQTQLAEKAQRHAFVKTTGPGATAKDANRLIFWEV